MHTNHSLFLSGILIAILISTGCQSKQEQATPPQNLYTKFQPISSADTLLVSLDSVVGDSGRIIPHHLFLTAINSSLIQRMIYEPDSVDFQGRAFWKASLDEHTEICLLEIKQVWFQFKYLLIYSSTTQSFIDIVPAAYLYGGDGGQIMSESWIYDLETKPTLLSRYLEHYLRMSETDPDEPKNINLKSVGLKQWSDAEFREISVQDSSKWIKKYPLPWD